MATILALPILVMFVILQTVAVSRLPLLLGSADLVLLALTAWALQERVKNSWIWTIIGGLLVSLISAVPFFAPLIGYLVVTGLARILQRRVLADTCAGHVCGDIPGHTDHPGIVNFVTQG